MGDTFKGGSARGPGPIAGGLPAFGDIVSCHFPEAELPGRPGPKARPCLALRAMWSDKASRLFIEVVYGTSGALTRDEGAMLSLDDPERAREAGLARPTRFLFERRRMLPFSPQWFRMNSRGTTILGRIGKAEREYTRDTLRAMRARDARNRKAAEVFARQQTEGRARERGQPGGHRGTGQPGR